MHKKFLSIVTLSTIILMNGVKADETRKNHDESKVLLGQFVSPSAVCFQSCANMPPNSKQRAECVKGCSG